MKNFEKIIDPLWKESFTPLLDYFENWVTRPPNKGAFCVMRNDKSLVEAWGMSGSKNDPWLRETKVCCFSVTKGVLSLLAHVLIDEGAISLETKISEVWPQFAINGKENITLRDVLTHRSGLPVVSTAVMPGDLYNYQRMIEIIEKSGTFYSPVSSPIYHNMTYGHLLGETLRRATGSASISALLKDRISIPLEVDFSLGISDCDKWAVLTQENPDSLFKAVNADPESIFARSMSFFSLSENFNSREWQSSEIGSGNGHSTSASLAKIYGQFVWDNAIISKNRQKDLAIETGRSFGLDPILGIGIRYGQGVQLNNPPYLAFGPNEATVGFWGAGGAQAWADAETGLSFAFVTGHMRAQMGSSEPANILTDKCFKAFYEKVCGSARV